MEQVELSQPIPALAPRTMPDGHVYEAARVLLRLHDYPLGQVELPMTPAGIEPGALTARVRAELGGELAAHLAADGIDPGTGPGPALAVDEPACQAGRRAVLADPPQASVVIATARRPEVIGRCVDSLLELEYPADAHEILVVDNAPSEPGTRELVESRYGDRDSVRYETCEARGASNARNLGVERARGEFVAVTDDDVAVDPHWLTELIRGFDAAPGVGFVTGLVLPAELDTPAQLLFQQFGGFAKGFERHVWDLGPNRPDNPLFPYNAGSFGSGNSVAFRREAFLEVGGFDPALGPGTPALGGEDLELFLRLARAGHGIAYEPGAICFHRDRAEYDQLRRHIHDYGVDLAAAMTSAVAHDPRALLEIARRGPYALWFLLSDRSPKNEAQSAAYPKELRRAELAGIARGPFAYAKSRRAARR